MSWPVNVPLAVERPEFGAGLGVPEVPVLPDPEEPVLPDPVDPVPDVPLDPEAPVPVDVEPPAEATLLFEAVVMAATPAASGGRKLTSRATARKSEEAAMAIRGITGISDQYAKRSAWIWRSGTPRSRSDSVTRSISSLGPQM